MNLFLGYLIQNQDEISEKIIEQYSSENSDKFLSIINKYDAFEVIYFHNLEKLDIGDRKFNNYDFQIGKDCIILKQSEIELIFSLPINNSVEHDIMFDDNEIDFDNIEQYIGKKVYLSYDDNFPHIFMTQSQIKSNIDYLTDVINELLLGIGFNTNVNKSELAILLGEDH
jgi:hypothetical protein